MDGNHLNVAVVGATGAVGEAMIAILEERRFPVARLYPLASRRSAGREVMFQGRAQRVEALEDFEFANVAIALFSAGASVAGEDAPSGRCRRLHGGGQQFAISLRTGHSPRGVGGSTPGLSMGSGSRGSSPTPIARRFSW